MTAYTRGSAAIRSAAVGGTESADDWRDHANCRDAADADLFFPVGTSGPAIQQRDQAIAICRRCKVRQACLDWAIDNRADEGVWGGMSETARLDERRRRTRAVAA